MNATFPEFTKKLGFGFMRLPKKGEDIDLEHTARMVDLFLAAGFQYFDTAYPYYMGKSETVLRDCLVSRYPRESFLLANKLSAPYFETQEEIRPFFQQQLTRCSVEYFDYYLFHAMSEARHERFLTINAYDEIQQLKKEGKIRHVGLSFHDTPEVLERILTDRPELEFVQLQFNYVDYEDPEVESRRCYEVCQKYGKPVFVMEPVRGGSLVNLPQRALEKLTGGSPASYAIRFAASFPGVAMVLSGMSNEEQLLDNVSFMKDFIPLTPEEHKILAEVRTLYQAQHNIPCTACSYCTEGCPMEIPIPEIFRQINKSRGEEPKAPEQQILMQASACINCNHCTEICPQHLQIPQLLKETKNFF